jgi:hypothetical protein
MAENLVTIKCTIDQAAYLKRLLLLDKDRMGKLPAREVNEDPAIKIDWAANERLLLVL